ncbi:hypothetical protein F0U44_04110 [Nocardioides humilatus]|uniref:Uncharacterized protein n=1 Tax=Nocardioides humilatus TaxID=2607660 RepID=A0A5B1LL74_9ACTN|nr:hypothetical protein [Nocardioides humilatus]KAA1421481.1 hypothetical protein F0U44_04110 [Nocardioides humilatus]
MSDHEPPSVTQLWVSLLLVWLAVPATGVVIGAATDPLSSSAWFLVIAGGLVLGAVVLWRWISLQRPPT